MLWVSIKFLNTLNLFWSILPLSRILILNIVTPTRQYSANDLPAHLELKTRAKEQGIDHDPEAADIYKRGKSRPP